MRLTKSRQLIMDVFNKSDELMSAEMVSQKINDKTINLSTIYRTLELFFKQGIISKSIIGHTAYYYLVSNNHHHYMICLSCHNKVELDCHLDEITEEIAKKKEFKITQHDFTVYGYCNKCSQ